MAAKQLYQFGPFRLDAGERVLYRESEPVPLTPKALDTLVLLVTRHGHVVEKEELLHALWPGTFVEESNLTQHIFHLRRALSNGLEGKRYIETVPRRGYRFAVDVQELIEPGPPAGPAATRPRAPRRWVWMASATALLILAAIAGWKQDWLKRIGRRAPALVTVGPLTSYPGMEQFPTFSPDGKEVAFAWNGEKEDQVDVYVKPIGAGVPMRLTNDPEPECFLSWSPDGRSIAFLHCSPGTADGLGQAKVEIFVISLLGGGKRKVGEISLPLDPGTPMFAWTEDSKWLVIEDRSPPEVPVTSLFLLSIETGARRRLTQPSPLAQGDFRPAVSPDGRTLAFLRATTVVSGDIFLLELADDYSPRGKPRQLTHEAAYISDVMWTAGGEEVVYAIEREGLRSLWRVAAAGSASPEPVTSIGTLGFHVALSRQGNLMAYTVGVPDNDIWRLDLAAGRDPVRLISSTRPDMNPQVSPDGRRIVFASQRSGNWEIWACDRDGSNVAQVTSLGKSAGSPRWSPDGKQVVFDVSEGGNDDIYIVGAGGGKVRRFTSDRSSECVPSWSRDGKWIYFSSDRTGSGQIWKAPVAGGAPVQVTRHGGFGGFESPDGRHFYYAKASGRPTRLWRVSTEGGGEQEVAGSLQSWFTMAMADDGIFFMPALQSKVGFSIYFYSFAGGEVRQVAEVRKQQGVGFAASPDGKWILFGAYEFRGGDLVLVSNFR